MKVELVVDSSASSPPKSQLLSATPVALRNRPRVPSRTASAPAALFTELGLMTVGMTVTSSASVTEQWHAARLAISATTEVTASRFGLEQKRFFMVVFWGVVIRSPGSGEG